MGDETVISEQDRSGWFGASDTSYIMGNWNTKTFKNWWAKKIRHKHKQLLECSNERREHTLNTPYLTQ